MRVVSSISCCAMKRSRSAPTVAFVRDLELVGVGQEARTDLLGFLVGRSLGALADAFDLHAVDEHDPLAGRRVLAG